MFKFSAILIFINFTEIFHFACEDSVVIIPT